MHIALLGNGKTGAKLNELLMEEKVHQVTVFDRTNPPTLKNISAQNFDLAISFLPGDAFVKLIPELIKTKLPLVTGSTGFEWPGGFDEIDALLKKTNLTWIHGQNFSLGMNLVFGMIKALSAAHKIFDDYHFSLHETHHTKKLDAPSGTAKTWSSWLDDKVEISSERIGDVVGVHRLTLDTPFEKITLEHDAHDRKIFAAGALWAAKKLIQKDLPPGLYRFENLSQKELLQ